MISKVYLWDNNMVTVFDEHGQQMPAYQGALAQVQDLIVYNATDKTQYFLASWQSASHTPITLQQFREAK